MPDRARLACVLALVLASAVIAPLVAGPPSSLESLAGTWVRDPALSDDPVTAVRERRMRPPLIGPGGTGGPVGGGGVGSPIMSGRPGGGYTPDPDEAERARALMRLVTDGPDELMISVDGRAVTITTRAGRVTHLSANDQKVLEASEAGVQLERRTKWDDGALVTKFKVKGGGADGKQVYRPSGPRLTLEAVFDGDALRTVKVKHVYARKTAH
jgi:hypothetical protein